MARHSGDTRLQEKRQLIMRTGLMNVDEAPKIRAVTRLTNGIGNLRNGAKRLKNSKRAPLNAVPNHCFCLRPSLGAVVLRLSSALLDLFPL